MPDGFENIYMDYNASAPLCDLACEKMSEFMSCVGNPSSFHTMGQGVRGYVESARGNVADFFSTDCENVIFTSSGTEANNHVLKGVPVDCVMASATEHHSVLNARSDLMTLPVDSSGQVDRGELEKFLFQHQNSVLVSVMLANNETGIIEDIADLADLTHSFGGLFHCDVVQAVGRVNMDLSNLNADFLTLSAHKIGGPQGIGALIIRSGLSLSSLISGGSQERYRRAGTENVLGIVGLGAAISHLSSHPYDLDRVQKKRNFMEKSLQKIFPDLIVVGEKKSRLPNTSCLLMPQCCSEFQVMWLDLNGICVSSGSACSSGKMKTSHVLQAMGLGDQGNAIRVSLGQETTDEHIDYFIASYEKMMQQWARKAQRKKGI